MAGLAADPMEVCTARDGDNHLLWDGDRLGQARVEHFDPDWWRENGMVVGEAPGRGRALFLQTSDGGWVLRHYHRGGLLSSLLTDHYTWFGASRSRAFREWHLLAKLEELDLPAPAPVAARVVRAGNIYRADLITERVTESEPVADILCRQPLPAACWQALGGLLARFHAAGVWHADLNARNILMDADGGFTLIDFDRSRLRRPGRWCGRNLARLRRSLDKLHAEYSIFHFAEADWGALHGGYLSAR